MKFMDTENREKIWTLLGQDESDSKRLGLELLATLGEESFAELVEEPLTETALDTLLDLVANYPDAALQLVKKGYSSFSGAPFTLVQFRLVSGLLRVREPEEWGWMPNQLTRSDASWDDTAREEQFAFLTGVAADLKALGQQLLAEAGGLEKALPPADREARYEGYYGWVRPEEAGSKQPGWLATRATLREWLGDPVDSPRGSEALAFAHSLPDAVLDEVMRPVMVNDWGRPIVCFNTGFEGALLELFCTLHQRPCGAELSPTRLLKNLDLVNYTEPYSYCSVPGREPTPQELASLARLPGLEQLTIRGDEGLDLSPLAAAPALKRVALGGFSGGAQWLPQENRLETWEETADRYIEFFEGYIKEDTKGSFKSIKPALRDVLYKMEVRAPQLVGDVIIEPSSGDDDPEYTDEETTDENGEFPVNLNTCETCGKVIEELNRPDSAVTERYESPHHFHCNACEAVFHGKCVDCEKWGPHGYLEYETYAEDPLFFVAIDAELGLYEETCSACHAIRKQSPKKQSAKGKPARKKASKTPARRKTTAKTKTPDLVRWTPDRGDTESGTTGERLAGAERTKAVEKLKELLTQRDFDAIDTGIELAVNLGDASLFEEFLEGCSIRKGGQLHGNEFFPSSGNNSEDPTEANEETSYADYALLGLIAQTPQNARLPRSIRHYAIHEIRVNAVAWTRLPPGVSNFSELTRLNAWSCRSLEDVDGLAGCPKLEIVDFSHSGFTHLPNGLSGCMKLDAVGLVFCSSLENVDALANCKKLTKLDWRGCSSLRNLDGIENCTKLTQLSLYGCESLKNVDGLASCSKITNLDLSGCISLQNVDGLANCANLKVLNLRGCSSLRNLDGFEKCTKLTHLTLYGCESLKNTDGLSGCTNLKSLDLGNTPVKNVDGLSGCTNLKSLDLGETRVKNVDGLANCTKLTSLDVFEGSSLKNVDGLANCTKLTKLYLGSCESLKNVDGLSNCTKLTELSLTWCFSLENVDGIANCTKLTDLALHGCELLENVDALAGCKMLSVLDLDHCLWMMNVDGLADCTRLKKLSLDRCSDVKPLPASLKMETRSAVAAYQEQVKEASNKSAARKKTSWEKTKKKKSAKKRTTRKKATKKTAKKKALKKKARRKST